MGFNKPLFSGQSLAANSVSSPQTVVDAALYSIQAEFTGSVCSFSAKIQTSDDRINPTNWSDLADSAQTFTDTTLSPFTWNVSSAGYRWVQLVITDNSSGTNTGTISASINVKGPI